MIIKIPFKTPTINHLYWHRGNMKIMKTEAKELREQIEDVILKSVSYLDREELKKQKLDVVVEIFEDWLTKSGDIKRKDIQNREKFLVDSVFNSLDIDDKHIFKCCFEKKQSLEDYAIITIRKM